jgi:hypothetical protein
MYNVYNPTCSPSCLVSNDNLMHATRTQYPLLNGTHRVSVSHRSTLHAWSIADGEKKTTTLKYPSSPQRTSPLNIYSSATPTIPSIFPFPHTSIVPSPRAEDAPPSRRLASPRLLPTPPPRVTPAPHPSASQPRRPRPW